MAEISRLPGPAAHQWVWQQHGSCRRLSPDAFFHPEGERGSARVSRATAAKRVCDDCPVLTQCRIHALSAREPYGIWGGLTEEDRERIYARIAIADYPRARGEGADMCSDDIADAVSPGALGIA